jgi:hypothetical protein
MFKVPHLFYISFSNDKCIHFYFPLRVLYAQRTLFSYITTLITQRARVDYEALWAVLK